MEVQQHGNYYEDLKTRQITGLDKKTYDSLKSNGYTSGTVSYTHLTLPTSDLV